MKVPGIKYVQGRNSYSPTQKYGIAIHNTSNTASAANEASYATRRTDGVSSHFYADKIEVIQSLDTENRAGHAGSTNGNYNAVAVEIAGVNANSRQWWIDNVNWDQLGYTLAQVCKATGTQVRRASVAEMQSNPKVKAFYSHNDMRLAWGGTTHNDPGDNFPWDILFASVNKYLDPNFKGDELTPDQQLMLAQVHALLRSIYWNWGSDRETYLKAGGNATVWDYAGGMGSNGLAQEIENMKLQINGLKEALAEVIDRLEAMKTAGSPAATGTAVGKLYVDVEKLNK